MGIYIPTTIGGTISASDSDTISSDLDVSGLPPGTRVWNADVGAFFVLTDSTAELVTDEVLAVKGITGARWILEVRDHWLSDVATIAANAVPELTDFKELTIGENALPTPIADPGGLDAGIPGGGVKNEASKNTAFALNSMFQELATAPWAIAFKFKVSQSPTNNKFNFIGLIDATGVHFYGFASYFNKSATNYVGFAYNASVPAVVIDTGVTADTGWHTAIVTSDATTMKVFIDGAAAGSTTDLSGLADEAVYAGMFGTDAGKVICSRFACGFAL